MKLSRSATKPKKSPVRPMKTQISPASAQSYQSSLCGLRIAKDLRLHHADSDWADAETDLSLYLLHIVLVILSCSSSIILQLKLLIYLTATPVHFFSTWIHFVINKTMNHVLKFL